MPSRIIKDSACTSDTLAAVSAAAERLFWRLVVQADDHGCLDGRPNIVRGKCLTSMLDRVTEANVNYWLGELAEAGLIERYSVQNRPYIHLTTWDAHQRPARSKPKFPLPTDERAHMQKPEMTGNSEPLTTDERDLPPIADNCGQLPPSFVFSSFRDSGVVNRDENICAPGKPERGRMVPTPKECERLFNEHFWPAYPKRRSKGRALKAWLKLRPDADLTAKMLDAIARQRASPDWRREGGQFVPYPASWLNDRGWENEDGADVAPLDGVSDFSDVPEGGREEDLDAIFGRRGTADG